MCVHVYEVSKSECAHLPLNLNMLVPILLSARKYATVAVALSLRVLVCVHVYEVRE